LGDSFLVLFVSFPRPRSTAFFMQPSLHQIESPTKFLVTSFAVAVVE
jgi:hypothetical protein